jgi:hypothetical protein
MQNHDWIALFRLIPAEQHNTLVLTTLSGTDINLETILRTELNYVVFRGRSAGSAEDGRVFFLPYRQIDFVHINRQVKEVEIRELYGERVDEQVGTSPDANGALAAGGQLSNGSAQGDQLVATGLPASPQSPSAPAPIGPLRPSYQGMSTRFSSVPNLSIQSPPVANRPSNTPGLAQPGGAAPRSGNVPAAALVPPGAPAGNGNGNGSGEQPAPARNSILERLRAQRNSILPPKPPGR